MDATRELTFAPPTIVAADPRLHEKQAEQLLDALKAALETPGEHRLFRWGKLPGLFVSRVGPAAAAATMAVRDSLLEITRTETKGKLVVEWVRATPKALHFVHDHDSPKATLRELREVLKATREGVPVWMEQARDDVSQLAMRFEHRANEVLERLDKLSDRVETALRRAEANVPNTAMGKLVPWGMAALEYLDRRAESIAGVCPLPDLFRALAAMIPELTLPQFQDGLRRLHDARAVRLVPMPDVLEPEFAFVVEKQMVAGVLR
ncbi:hypothetical protein BH11PLA2_BH11PLA2_35650 [soil metagenome]